MMVCGHMNLHDRKALGGHMTHSYHRGDHKNPLGHMKVFYQMTDRMSFHDRRHFVARKGLLCRKIYRKIGQKTHLEEEAPWCNFSRFGDTQHDHDRYRSMGRRVLPGWWVRGCPLASAPVRPCEDSGRSVRSWKRWRSPRLKKQEHSLGCV